MRLLEHYRQIATSATLDDAHLVEGYMAETWTMDTTGVAARRAEVTARGRAQADHSGGDQGQPGNIP